MRIIDCELHAAYLYDFKKKNIKQTTRKDCLIIFPK